MIDRSLIFSTGFYYFSQLSIRLGRFIKHFTGFFLASAEWKNNYRPRYWHDWLAHLFLYVLDILAFPEVYELTLMLFKWNTRGVNRREKELIQSVFADHIDIRRIKLDDRALIGPKRFKFAYVSFNTINYFGKLRDEILIHECVHIWQFQNFGSIYLYEALKAQHSEEKYDYGGVEGLYATMTKGGKLLSFNFEQQGDIIEDYFCLQQELEYHENILARRIYEYYVNQLDVKYYTKP